MSDKPEGDSQIHCWCGAVGDYDELFSDMIDETCGGAGTLHCECGGDGLCVCHWHGETSCDGCEDCRDFDDSYDDDEFRDLYGDDVDY